MKSINLSVYEHKSQLLDEPFAAIPTEKIMIILLDYGKKSFAGQAIRGNGDYLVKRPWNIWNSRAGVDFLTRKIQGLFGTRPTQVVGEAYIVYNEHVSIGIAASLGPVLSLLKPLAGQRKTG